MNVLTALTVFAVIFPAELPDKSLFASLVLGTRLRPLWTWFGVSAAFVLHVVIAVAAGGLLTLLPPRVVTGVVALLFSFAAGWMLLGGHHAEQNHAEQAATHHPEPDTDSEASGPDSSSDAVGRAATSSRPTPAGARVALAERERWLGFGRTFWTAFGVVFVGEWGDITQIATANLAAKYGDPLSVGVGAAAALCAVAALAVAVGRSLLRWISVTMVRRVAGLILAVLALLSLVQLVRG